MFFALAVFCCSLPHYRTTFTDAMPRGFSPSKDTRTFEKRIGDLNYKCYVLENQTPTTQLSPEAYLKSILHPRCFPFTATHYWFFEFCPFNQLRQYRIGDDGQSRVDQFVLAKETSATTYKVEGRALTAAWGAGDICVITKRPRTAKIEFVCDQSADDSGTIESVSEPSFCNYLVKFHTQHACANPNITSESLAAIVCVKQNVTAAAQATDEL
jgi:hypothetical protein